MSSSTNHRATEVLPQTGLKSNKRKEIEVQCRLPFSVALANDMKDDNNDSEGDESQMRSIDHDSPLTDEQPLRHLKASTTIKRQAIAANGANGKGPVPKPETSSTPTSCSASGKEPSADPEFTITDVKPAPRRPRLTAKNASARANLPSAVAMKKMAKPPPPRRLSVGAIGFLKPLNAPSNAAMRGTKIVVSVNEVKYDNVTKQWFCLVENQGNLLPAGCTWWEPEKSLEIAMEKGTEVMVNVNKSWVEGVIEGVEREDDNGCWTYECDVVGTVKVSSANVKLAQEGHKYKLEKTVKNEKTEVEQESGAWLTKHEAK